MQPSHCSLSASLSFVVSIFNGKKLCWIASDSNIMNFHDVFFIQIFRRSCQRMKNNRKQCLWDYSSYKHHIYKKKIIKIKKKGCERSSKRLWHLIR